MKNREKLISALIAGDIQAIATASGKNLSKFHLFYTSEENMTVTHDGEMKIEYNEQGIYYDAGGSQVTYQDIQELSAKSEFKTKRTGFSDLIWLTTYPANQIEEKMEALKK